MGVMNEIEVDGFVLQPPHYIAGSGIDITGRTITAEDYVGGEGIDVTDRTISSTLILGKQISSGQSATYKRATSYSSVVDAIIVVNSTTDGNLNGMYLIHVTGGGALTYSPIKAVPSSSFTISVQNNALQLANSSSVTLFTYAIALNGKVE